MQDYNIFVKSLADRVLILDGGFGTMLQTYDLTDEITRKPGDNGGCNDLLSVTRPDIVADIHRRYLEAGADIIETNSFNANAISLSDYDLQHRAYEIAHAATRVARGMADKYSTPDRRRFVAGSIGPTNRTLSMSADVESPAAREVVFEQMCQAYADQVRGLIDGGADLLIVETVFDTLNAKAALAAIRMQSQDIPVIVSATISDASGRTLTGQTVEAFCASVLHARPIAVGLNCGFGAASLLPYLRRLAAVSPVRISVHPNAGLPNIDGGYDQAPDAFAAELKPFIDEHLVNIIGGCCGTTPDHIRALAKMAHGATPRQMPDSQHICVLSGLEPLSIVPEANFINVGERTNVAGSAKFARLIREHSYAEALSIAKAQVDAGAQIVDVCMDAPMIDAADAMRTFLNLMASEPEVSRVPVMIDSSDFSVIEAGLQCTQGKSIVNSISLKEGEKIFLDHARRIMLYGAATVVMLFDEQGQADTYERKVQVAKRAYTLLTGIGFPAEDIIFDPNILAVATGMPEHDRYARDFIDATSWIKANLPHAKVSGGVSNLSFAFRGNNIVRKAMHSVFLYHAIKAGMDMAIVNPQMVQIYDDIEPQLLERVEDLVLYRRGDAAERLIELAGTLSAQTEGPAVTDTQQWRTLPVGERILHAMLKGDNEYIADDTLAAYAEKGDAVGVINDVLMPAMTTVGSLFAQGKLFLPQVVKSARVMKQAVGAIEPYIVANSDNSSTSRPVVIATVRGDVHDIGKNIVSVVLSCNGFKVSDLGVMVEPTRIIDEAVDINAVAICLSGLITPSLVEMARVIEEAERRRLNIPIIVGGATTSARHTAVRLAPLYSGVVIHSTDAADNAAILQSLCAADRDSYIRELKAGQSDIRDKELTPGKTEHKGINDTSIRTCSCCGHAHQSNVHIVTATIDELIPKINWSFFFAAWGIPGHYPEVVTPDAPEKHLSDKSQQAKDLYTDAQTMLGEMATCMRAKGVVGDFAAGIDGDDIVLDGVHRLPMLRNLSTGESICDYVDGNVKLFALTAALGADEMINRYRDGGDEYKAIIVKLLCDRLTEAFAEHVLPGGCRVAIGYPSAPDHTLKRDVFALLDVERLTGMRLVGNCMIMPAESVCGIWLPEGRFVDTGIQTASSIADYAKRRGMSTDEVKLYLSSLAAND